MQKIPKNSKSQLICIICLAFCNIWRKLFSITRIPRAKMFMAVETKLRSAMLVLEVSLSFAASVVGLFAILRPSRWFPPRGSTQCCKIKRHDTLELPWSQKWCSGKTKHDHTNVCTWVGTTNGVIWWPPWSQAALTTFVSSHFHRTESTCRCRQLYYNLQFWKPALTSYKK